MLTPAPPIREKTKTIVITVLLIIAVEKICVSQEFVQEIEKSIYEITTVEVKEIARLVTLENSLGDYLIRELAAETELFNYKEKGKGLKYIPTVGFQFGLPSISWSTNTIYTAKRDKQIKEAALKSLEKKYQVRYTKEINNLINEYRKYEMKSTRLFRSEIRATNDSLIFAIHREAYSKNEISPLEFYTKRKAYLSVLESIENQKEDLELLRLSIYQLAYFNPKDNR